jgi:hypothetical protein
MRITVFGATGATGRKVVELGIAQGHEVVAVARRTQGTAPAQRVLLRQGDVLNAASVDAAVAASDVAISCIGPAKNLSPGTRAQASAIATAPPPMKTRRFIAFSRAYGERWGAAINAAIFLREFIGDTPWVQLDIAGPSTSRKERSFLAKGATGVGVRTLVEFIRRRGSGREQSSPRKMPARAKPG